MWRILTLMLAILLTMPTMADVQTNELEDPELQSRYQSLTRELRCPLCQNENIAESGAPIANDMRREVHRRLEQGQSDEEIVDALVERFGDFVRYRPEMSARTMLLWYGPFAGIAVGVMIVVILGIRAKRRREAEDQAGVSAKDRARAEKLLRDNDR